MEAGADGRRLGPADAGHQHPSDRARKRGVVERLEGVGGLPALSEQPCRLCAAERLEGRLPPRLADRDARQEPPGGRDPRRRPAGADRDRLGRCHERHSAGLRDPDHPDRHAGVPAGRQHPQPDRVVLGQHGGGLHRHGGADRPGDHDGDPAGLPHRAARHGRRTGIRFRA